MALQLGTPGNPRRHPPLADTALRKRIPSRVGEDSFATLTLFGYNSLRKGNVMEQVAVHHRMLRPSRPSALPERSRVRVWTEANTPTARAPAHISDLSIAQPFGQHER